MKAPGMSQEERDAVGSMVKQIFDLFAREDPPIGVAAQATTIALVQLAIKAGVARKDLIRSVGKMWRASAGQRGDYN